MGIETGLEWRYLKNKRENEFDETQKNFIEKLLDDWDPGA
jgi:hypothetical protein